MASSQQQQSATSGSAGAWGAPQQSQQSTSLGWGTGASGGGGSNDGRGESGDHGNGNLGPIPSQVKSSDSFGPQRNNPSGSQGTSPTGPQANSAWNNANWNQSSSGWGTAPINANSALTPALASAWASAAPQTSSDDAGRAVAWNQPQRKSSGPPASSYPDNGIQSRPSGFRAQPPHMQQAFNGNNGGGPPQQQQGGRSQFFGQGEGNGGDTWATGVQGQGSYGGQQRPRPGPPPSFASSSRQGGDFGGGDGGAFSSGTWVSGRGENPGYGSQGAYGTQEGGEAPGPRRYVPPSTTGSAGYGGGAYGGIGGDEIGGGRGSFRDMPRQSTGPFIAEMPHINWEKEKLPEFHKDFYTEHENVRNRSMEEVEEWRGQKNILVEGEACKPVTSWIEAMLPDYIGDHIKEKHFVEPTPIQCQALPIACGGGDLVAISETGSGKTLAYAIPACMHVNAQEPTEQTPGPIALVLAPTRELAMQILEDFKGVGGSTDIKSVAVYGGVSRARQRSVIANGAFDVLIATPGRLIDMVCSGDIQLKRVTYLVIDEADRMINEGFEEELREIISCVRKDRQVLMFLATWPSEVRNLAEEYLKNAVRITVGKDEIVAAHSIKQEVFVCHGYREKLDKLVDLLEEVKIDKGRVLVFANSKASVAELVEELREHPNKYQALGLHGNLPQEERDFALGEFRNGTHPVLLATDLAQRGLDIPSVTLVINFDAPNEITSYVHRIGRTGRAGHTGRAITFLSSSRDYHIAPQIKRVITESQQQITPEFEDYLAESGTSDSFADSFAAEAEGAEPAASSAGASWGPQTDTAEQDGSGTTPAAGTWGSASNALKDSASTPSWNASALHSDSTESVAGSSVDESASMTQHDQSEDADAIERSYDSGHGESRIEQGVKAVRIDVPEEGDLVTGNGAKSIDEAEEPRIQKSDDDWIKELLARTPIAEQHRLQEDKLAVQADPLGTQIDDGTESDGGSGAITPIAGRARSPVSYADLA